LKLSGSLFLGHPRNSRWIPVLMRRCIAGLVVPANQRSSLHVSGASLVWVMVHTGGALFLIVNTRIWMIWLSNRRSYLGALMMVLGGLAELNTNGFGQQARNYCFVQPKRNRTIGDIMGRNSASSAGMSYVAILHPIFTT